MTLAKARGFKQCDVTRALRAAQKAGVAVRIEIEPGKLTLIPVHKSELDENGKELEPNPW